MNVVNITQKFELFDEHWQPKIVGELNDSYVKLAKLKGEFIWHHHEEEDELFFVVKGINYLRRMAAQEPEAAKAAEPPRQEKLLEEIRDLLAKKT